MSEQTQWQPIETAPKDKVVDLWVSYGGAFKGIGGRITECMWSEKDKLWFDDRDEWVAGTVTHWMTLPKPPE